MRAHLLFVLGPVFVAGDGIGLSSRSCEDKSTGVAPAAHELDGAISEDEVDFLSLLQGPTGAVRTRNVSLLQAPTGAGRTRNVLDQIIEPTFGEIPKIIHHVYQTDLKDGPWPSRVWEAAYASWKKFFPEPEYKHFFWADADMAVFFEKKCPSHWKAYKSETRYIVRSDLSRYCLLSKIGGIYADLDYEVRRNFYDFLKPGMVNLIESPYWAESVQNSLMASPPGLPYWDKLMGLVDRRKYQKESKLNVLAAAGPRIFDELKDTRNPKVVHVLPCNNFQRATHEHFGQGQNAKNKGCRLLSEGWKDTDLMGVHWGTSSYSNPGDKREIDALFDKTRVQLLETRQEVTQGRSHEGKAA